MESLHFSLQVQTGSVWQFGAFNGQMIPFQIIQVLRLRHSLQLHFVGGCSACPLGQVFEDAWPQMKLE